MSLNKLSPIEALQQQFADVVLYYKTGRFKDAVAGFKYCQQQSREMQSSASEAEQIILRRIEIESARNKGQSYFSLFKKVKAYSAFCESYSLAKAMSDRICMAHALVGMSRCYENKSMDDNTKTDYATQALAIASAVYDETLTLFNNEAPPLLLPPFGAGSGPLLNTLRNKLYVGELQSRGDLDGKLAEAQSLLTLAQDAVGKARKSSW